jgi:hypothetical protein
VPQERHVKADEGEMLRSASAASVRVCFPHPALRATFSRREKGSRRSGDPECFLRPGISTEHEFLFMNVDLGFIGCSAYFGALQQFLPGYFA